jgi:hypothetical protein
MGTLHFLLEDKGGSRYEYGNGGLKQSGDGNSMTTS